MFLFYRDFPYQKCRNMSPLLRHHLLQLLLQVESLLCQIRVLIPHIPLISSSVRTPYYSYDLHLRLLLLRTCYKLQGKIVTPFSMFRTVFSQTVNISPSHLFCHQIFRHLRCPHHYGRYIEHFFGH